MKINMNRLEPSKSPPIYIITPSNSQNGIYIYIYIHMYVIYVYKYIHIFILCLAKMNS